MTNKMIVRGINGIRRRWQPILGVVMACALVLSGLQIDLRAIPDRIDRSIHNSSSASGMAVIRLGSPAEAAGSVDYTFDGVDDDVQFQLSLNALPATGGRLVVVSAVQINFAVGMAATGVTRAIDNVTIEGSGRGTYFARNAAAYLFTAGGNNWKFVNLRTDAGSINMAVIMWGGYSH